MSLLWIKEIILFKDKSVLLLNQMAAQRALPQSKEALLKSYTTRLKDDVKSMLENFEGAS